MKFIRMLLRTFKEAFKNIIRQRWLSLSSILSITLTLILTSASLVMSLNINKFTQTIAQGLTVHIYLKKEVTRDISLNIEEEIRKTENVKDVVYQSKDEQLKLVLENYDESQKKILQDYKEMNPLDDVLIVTLIDPNLYLQFKEKINAKFTNYIENIEYQEKIASSVLPIFNNINKGMYVLIFLVGFVALILIANTIRVTILARRTDITIMRLVAADNWYIRMPFIIEGVILGILSAFLASFIILSTYDHFYPFISSKLLYGTQNILLPTFCLVKSILQLTSFIGAIIGFLGSIFPVSKYLKS